MADSMRTSGLICLLFALVGCASVPPTDQTRPLLFEYELVPETTEAQRRVINQGEIFFKWDAIVRATHESATGAKLAAISTGHGNLYCGDTEGIFYCYEDQDGDDRFDRRWYTAKETVMVDFLVAREPEMLVTPIPFSALEDGDDCAARTASLGLIYNGPVEGVLNEDMEFLFGIAELRLGWIEDVKAPRTPEGGNWSGIYNLRTVRIGSVTAKMLATPLDFTFEAYAMDIEGAVDLWFQAGEDGLFNYKTKNDLKVLETKNQENSQETEQSGV